MDFNSEKITLQTAQAVMVLQTSPLTWLAHRTHSLARGVTICSLPGWHTEPTAWPVVLPYVPCLVGT